MFLIIGLVLVLASVFGGYSIHGDLRVLWQPIEYVIIGGQRWVRSLLATPRLFGWAPLSLSVRSLKGQNTKKLNILNF